MLLLFIRVLKKFGLDAFGVDSSRDDFARELVALLLFISFAVLLQKSANGSVPDFRLIKAVAPPLQVRFIVRLQGRLNQKGAIYMPKKMVEMSKPFPNAGAWNPKSLRRSPSTELESFSEAKICKKPLQSYVLRLTSTRARFRSQANINFSTDNGGHRRDQQ
jgi:hypothetical protein